MDQQEYKIAIDAQVQEFLTMKQKLTFFLTTAAIGSLGFTLAFATKNLSAIGQNTAQTICLYIAAITAMVAVGSALLSLHNEIASFRFHLKYRYLKKEHADLTPEQQCTWEKAINRAKGFLTTSFLFLVLTIIAQSAVFSFDLHKETSAMHHYGESSTKVESDENAFEIKFTNKETDQTITLRIPRVGVHETSEKVLTLETVKKIGDRVVGILKEELE